MQFIVRSKKNWTGGGMSLIASGPRVALDQANRMIEEGTADVQVVKLGGEPVEMADLEELVRVSEQHELSSP